LRVLLHVLHGVAIVLTSFRALGRTERRERVRWWAGKMLRVAGVGYRSSGEPWPGGALLVANHISWLDIVAIHAFCPQARFVSKADVLQWPLLGWLIRNAGTLFIERERKRDALRVVHAMAESLQRGETVAVFPEGTTGEGPEPLPFHANLLQAAVATGTPVQPVVLRFFDEKRHFSDDVVFVGETTLLQSIWCIASARGLGVQVQLLSPVGTQHADRRRLAEHLRELIAERLVAP
ncbi:MAG: lysophospholipid acyltransferase family protein, partial [Rubrivivax sp.]|nr:lysophospholipid acyltransferase family protein [Rubrivivax sp.]